MAINLDNRVIHRFIQDISAYELGGEYYSQIIPLDTQAYAIYPNEEDNYLFYVIGDGEHTYTELRDGKGNGPAYKEYPVLTTENLGIMIGGVEEEARRRKEADDALRLQIEKEVSERKEFDELLDEALGEEIQNRESSENAILDVINNHIVNKENPHEVTAEQIGLGNVDNTSDLDKPISTATQAAIDELLGNITDEVTAREVADGLLQDAITDEETRAKSVEDFLQGQIDEINIDDLLQAIHDETDRATNAETDLQTAIESEETRATQAESLLSTAISGKQDQLTESQLQAVNSGVTDSVVAQVDTNRSDVQTIRSMIPNTASDQNQLADKQFVTSSVARESATFRGTYNSVEELNAYAGDKDNNDYAYVIVTDELGNQSYNEYKYNGNQWVYEFTLSGSTFTAEQWATINSGITSGLVDQISANETAITNINNSAPMLSGITSTKVSNYDSHLENISNPHNVTAEQIGLGNVDNTADLDKPISTATQNALDLKADDSDLQTALESLEAVSEDLSDISENLSEHIADVNSHVTAQEKEQWTGKQDALTAGQNIQIDNGVISATDTVYTAGNGISIENGVISNTQTSAEWGNITGTLSDQTDLNNILEAKANTSDLGTMAFENAADYSTKAVADTLYADISLEETVETHTSNDDIHVTLSDKQAWDAKQSALTAGSNIQINNGVISATDTTYTAGNGILIDNGVISNTQTSAEWGNITGTIGDQTDLQNALNDKQDTLVSGTNIKTINNQSILGNGNIVIEGGGTISVDQVYDPNSANAQSGVAINGANFISNTATGLGSITVGGTATNNFEATNVGLSSQATANYTVALGEGAQATGTAATALGSKTRATANNSVAIGRSARADGIGSIALGAQAKNLESYTFKVALTDGDDNHPAMDESTGLYTLLGQGGIIPDARLSNNIARVSDIPTVPTTDQHYDSTSTNPQSGTAVAEALATVNSAEWGNITGTLSDQTDLQNALNDKVNSSSLATVATSGDYDDLINKPTIPTVDQTYDSTSTNAQSGVAVAEALATVNSAEWGNITGTLNDQTDLQNVLDSKIDKYETFPNASESYENQIAQYIGLSNQSYTNGYFYKCINNGDIPDSITFTPNTGVETIVSITPENFVAFITPWCEGRSFGPSDVTHGTIGIYSSTQYSMTIETDDGDFAHGVFTITELEAAGFTFTPPFGSQQGATFVCSIGQKDYIWSQINVQPGGSGGNAEWGNITGTLSQQSDLQTALDAKANQATTYTKTEVDNLLSGIVVATVYNYEE